jgi:CRISPR-associated endonuclease/helicase Cas3
MRRPGGWAYSDAAKLAQEQLKARGSVLIVVNTKNAALSLYTQLQHTSGVTVCHLSTHMCPAHRKAKFDAINACLDPTNPQPVICISTQLIEAGVDLDFNAVIRSLAGLDSIAQAAGRCNRNGRSAIGPVFVINLAEENVSRLADISQGQDCARRILDDFKTNPCSLSDDLLAPAAMRQFYTYYFFRRASEMIYPLKAGEGSSATTCDTSLLDLLSENPAGTESYRRTATKNERPLPMRHALSTAAQAFRVIDAPTQGIVVPHGDEGRRIIGELASAYVTDEIPLDKHVELLRRAQQYTVNVFPHTLHKLSEIGAISEVRAESGIYYLDDRHYHPELGLTHEALSDLPFQNV